MQDWKGSIFHFFITEKVGMLQDGKKLWRSVCINGTPASKNWFSKFRSTFQETDRGRDKDSTESRNLTKIATRSNLSNSPVHDLGVSLSREIYIYILAYRRRDFSGKKWNRAHRVQIEVNAAARHRKERCVVRDDVKGKFDESCAALWSSNLYNSKRTNYPRPSTIYIYIYISVAVIAIARCHFA